ncbi:MAG: methyltransferase domain-containing protein [Vampirovibrionales bacterium]|nr:methyltransferase domain-containing protein [Vampirovibrionales bacterium]
MTPFDPSEFSVPLSSDDPVFWRQRYQQNETPWDLGTASPPLMQLAQTQPHLFSGEILSVGCGRGHDAAWVAQQFPHTCVTGLDVSPEALEGAKALYGKTVEWTVGDIFQPPTEFIGRFSAIIEHTCFCAIPPSRRKDYAKNVAAMLAPGGHLVGVFFVDIPLDEGPPFGSDPEALQSLFQSVGLQRTHWALATNSIERRQNEEWVGIFQKNLNISFFQT